MKIEAMFYSQNDYRSAIELALEKLNRNEVVYTRKLLSEKIKIQSSYFTKVMKGEASFNSDQLYVLCQTIQLDTVKRNFLLLLLELEKSTVEGRRKELLTEIEKIRQDKFKTEHAINIPPIMSPKESEILYFSNPWNQIIHAFLMTESFCQKTESIRPKIGVSEKIFNNVMENLKKIGLISDDGGVVKVTQKQIHLSQDSELFHLWKNAIKVLGNSKKLSMDDSESYSFSAVFCAPEDAHNGIKTLFLEFLTKAQEQANKGKATDVFQMNFDLFPWS